MKLIFVLAISLFHSRPAHAFQVIRSELRTLHWQQSTLLAGFTAPTANSAEQLTVSTSHGQTVNFELWKTNGTSRGLYIVVPGTGSDGNSRLASRIAEIIAQLNYDAIVVANPFSASFQMNYSSDGIVGLADKDSKDAVKMIRSAKAAYEGRYGRARELNIIGLSLGGLFAPLTARDGANLRFSKIIALDPPIDFEYAIKQVDITIQKLLAHDVSIPNLARDILNLFRLAPHGIYEGNANAVLNALPGNDIENEQIIGWSFFPVLQKITANLARTWAFSTPEKKRQLDRLHPVITFAQYTGLVSIPISRDRHYAGLTVRQILARVDLRTILRGNPEIAAKTYVLTNRDDLLVTHSMLTELETLIPDRLQVFEAGGHCGNYWTKEFQTQLARIVNLR